MPGVTLEPHPAPQQNARRGVWLPLLPWAWLAALLFTSAAASAAQPAVAAGRLHSLALDAQGQAWAWGSNASGQLGLAASVTRSEAPRPIPGLPALRAIAAYRDQSLALAEDGAVWAWGPQTGMAGVQKIAGLPAVTAIVQGAFHALFLTAQGDVWAWGQNANCQYGNGTVGDGSVLAPAQVPGLDDVVSLATGYDRSYARKRNGSVWVWGCLFDDFRNAIYALKVPTQDARLEQIWPIAVGLFDDAGIRADGQVATWGVQASIRLAVNDMFAPWLSGLIGGRFPAMGNHLLIARQDGSVGGLFNNGFGQLGTGSTGWASAPVDAAGVTRVQRVAAGESHSLLVDDRGQVYAAGDNTEGQAGLPGTTRVTSFRQVAGEGGVGTLTLGEDAAIGATTPAFEFHHAGLAHYFMTASAAEASGIDAGAAGAGWSRSGYVFRVWPQSEPQTSPVCRFYGNPALGGNGQRMGPNSHFYTLDAAECEHVKLDPGWLYEGVVFHAVAPVQGACPGGLRPLYRSYNNRFSENDSNHRYLTDPRLLAEMSAQGWSSEGLVMCLPW